MTGAKILGSWSSILMSWRSSNSDRTRSRLTSGCGGRTRCLPRVNADKRAVEAGHHEPRARAARAHTEPESGKPPVIIFDLALNWCLEPL